MVQEQSVIADLQVTKRHPFTPVLAATGRDPAR
jgi:hypothetical protein